MTLDFYDQHGQQFFERTRDIDLTPPGVTSSMQAAAQARYAGLPPARQPQRPGYPDWINALP